MLPSSPDEPIILVADDDDLFRTPLVNNLSFFGYSAFEAQNGEQLQYYAEEMIPKYKKFLIIVDNQMMDTPQTPEKQWSGFERILTLCNKFPHFDLAAHVIFLSRWELQDLPDDLRTLGRQHGLLQPDRWWSLYTPFAILKAHIERMLL